jgi:hypothetical protein
MIRQHLLAAQAVDMTRERRQTLLRIQAFYRKTGDNFSMAELERLLFVRWLYRTGRLAS